MAAVAEEAEAMVVAIINSLINFQKIIIIRVNFIFFFYPLISITLHCSLSIFFFLLFCRWLVSLSFFSLTFVLQHIYSQFIGLIIKAYNEHCFEVLCLNQMATYLCLSQHI